MFWLAFLTLLPIFIGFKSERFGLVLSPATLVYTVFHGAGIYVWMQVQQLQRLPDAFDRAETAEHLRTTWRWATAAKPLGYAVTVLLVTTALAKVELDTGSTRHVVRLPGWVYGILGVPTPLRQVVLTPNFNSIAALPQKTMMKHVDASVECRAHHCFKLQGLTSPLPRNGVLLGGGDANPALLGEFRRLTGSSGANPASLSPNVDVRKGDVLSLELCCERDQCEHHEWKVRETVEENVWELAIGCF